jgi:hypothetical protein
VILRAAKVRSTIFGPIKPLTIALLQQIDILGAVLHRIGSDGHIGHRAQYATDRQTPDRGAGLLVQFSLAPYLSRVKAQL